MKRKRNVIQLTEDQIQELRSKRRTYEDFGFNHLLNKKSVLKEQERVRKELREQEEHEMKMRLIEEQLKQLNQNPTPEAKPKIVIKPQPSSTIISYEWKPEPEYHRAILIIGGKELPFRGGNFGLLNPLFKSFNCNVKTQQLKGSIAKYIQGQRKNTNEITVSQWKYDLKRNRSDFFNYFDIKFDSPDNYKLTYRSS